MDQQNPSHPEQSTLRETCVLVEYHGGFTNWKKRDAKASETFSKQTTNNSQSYQNYKNIFVGCDGILQSVKGLINEARSFHYSFTLPAPKSWGDAAFIANKLVPRYRQSMTDFEMKLDSLKTHLKNEWDSMKKEAKLALGSAYNESDYDDIDSVLEGCYIRIDFRPVPSPNDISESNPTLSFIREAVGQQQIEGLDHAITNLWGKLFDAVKAAKDNLNKLSPSDGRFRTEWVENMRSLLPALRNLNVTQDPKFDEMADAADKLLRYDEKVLKNDISARAQLAREANKLFDRLSAVYATKAGE